MHSAAMPGPGAPRRRNVIHIWSMEFHGYLLINLWIRINSTD